MRLFKDLKYWLHKTEFTKEEMFQLKEAFNWGCQVLNVDSDRVCVKVEARKKLSVMGICKQYWGSNNCEIIVYKNCAPVETLLHELVHAQQYINEGLEDYNSKKAIWNGTKTSTKTVEAYAYAMETCLLIKFNQYMVKKGYEGVIT